LSTAAYNRRIFGVGKIMEEALDMALGHQVGAMNLGTALCPACK